MRAGIVSPGQPGPTRFSAGSNGLTGPHGSAMLKDMKTYSHLKPGQKGTRRLVEQYGPALLCVRYRFDKKRGIRLKTVEIVVEEKPLIAPRFKDEDVVPVSVAYEETELREQLRNMHAKWDPRLKVWFARYRLIRGTALESRIVAA